MDEFIEKYGVSKEMLELKDEPTFKCPECGSVKIFGAITIRTTVDVRTGDFEEGPIDRYIGSHFEELFCDDCDHIWKGDIDV